MLAYQKDALTGHRPTWKMGTGKTAKGRPDLAAPPTPFDMFHEMNGKPGSRPDPEHKPEQRIVRNAERKALETLGLEAGVDRGGDQSAFQGTGEAAPPDANGGDRSTEDRLVEIIQAYKYLKSVGFG